MLTSSGGSGPCLPLRSGTTVSRTSAKNAGLMSLSRSAVSCGPGQADVVAQGRSGVLGPGDALPLQDGHDVIDERVELAGQHVGHDRKPVGGAGLPPFG